MQTGISPWNYVMIWEFEVSADFRSQFESVYGPDGDWAKFFRSGEGFAGTELIRNPGRGLYLTLDFWQSREKYELFRERNRAQYQEIDRQCERLTVREREIGAFERVSSLSG